MAKAEESENVPRKVACIIDIGGGSVKMETRPFDGGDVPKEHKKLFKKMSADCNLAAKLQVEGKMCPDAKACAKTAIREFMGRIADLKKEGYEVYAEAYGTAPFRDPENEEKISKDGKAFAEEIKAIFDEPFPGEIDAPILLRGKEEAYWEPKACADRNPGISCIFFDTGGGSTEFALIINGEVQKDSVISLPLGMSRIAGEDDPEQFVADHIALLPDIFKRPDLPLVASGGVFRALVDSVMSRFNEESLPTHVYVQTISLCALFFQSKFEGLEGDELKDLAKTFKFKAKRAGQLLYAQILFGAIADFTGSEEILRSKVSLRDALFDNLINKVRNDNDVLDQKAGPPHLEAA